MCIMHPKYKSTPATNSCNRGGFIRKGVLTLPAPFFTQLQINLWYKNFMYVCSSREMVGSVSLSVSEASSLKPVDLR